MTNRDEKHTIMQYMNKIDETKIAQIQENFSVKFEIYNAELKYKRSLRRIGI